MLGEAIGNPKAAENVVMDVHRPPWMSRDTFRDFMAWAREDLTQEERDALIKYISSDPEETDNGGQHDTL